VPETRQRQLLGDGVATDPRLLLEHDDVEARSGQVCGADEAVVAGTDDHDIGAVVAHARPLSRVR